jgi:hypothetical protein
VPRGSILASLSDFYFLRRGHAIMASVVDTATHGRVRSEVAGAPTIGRVPREVARVSDRLKELLAAAAAAGPLGRMDYRDLIAAEGEAAIPVLTEWLGSRDMGALAARTLTCIGRTPAMRSAALRALTSARGRAPTPGIARDIADAIVELTGKSPRRASAAHDGVPTLCLQFGLELIPELSHRYRYRVDPTVERRIVDDLAPAARKRGYFTYDEFLYICHWKTQRSKPLIERNEPAVVEAAMQTALSTKSERRRIEVLRSLDGVDWATASVFLHFGYVDLYPIVDFRALEALGVPRRDGRPIHISTALWEAYVRCCRDIASRAHVDMRTLDRALWQWSNENGASETE